MQTPQNVPAATHQGFTSGTAPPTAPSESANHPVKRISYGRVHATIWQRQFPNEQQDGFDVSICRKYKNNTGTWCESHSFSPADLPCLRVVLECAIRFLCREQEVDVPKSPKAGHDQVGRSSVPANPQT